MVAVNRNAPNVSRFRTPLLILIGVAFVVFLSASGVAKLYTDYLFFDRLELASVWRGIIGIQFVGSCRSIGRLLPCLRSESIFSLKS